MEPIKIDFNAVEFEKPTLKAGVEYNETQGESFTETLGKAMDNLKETHEQSSKMMQAYASGEDVDISEVMIAMEKTAMTTELAMQIRNKLVEGYQEIIKLQI